MFDVPKADRRARQQRALPDDAKRLLLGGPLVHLARPIGWHSGGTQTIIGRS